MFFCKLCKTPESDLDVHVFHALKDINQFDWNKVAQNKSIYLSLDYLSALERNLSHEITFRFMLFYQQKKPVAIAVLQSLKFMDKGLNNRTQVSETRQKIKKYIFNSFELKVLTCGTPFACGETGFAYTTEISRKDAFQNLSLAILKLQKEDNELGAKTLLLKEFWQEDTKETQQVLDTNDFHQFEIDVNMVLKVPFQWKSIDDYLASFKTKFRTKAKRAFKKSSLLVIKNLSHQEVSAHKLDIERLYGFVLEKSEFTFGSLNGNVFVDLKKNLKDRFIIKGYFLNDQLVGFSSAFIFNNIVDANYVGINYSFNRNYATYERMLYDYVQLAIEHNCTEVRFGRTAEEIKSTIGAAPVPMDLFIRHQHHIQNKILKSIFGSIQPNSFEMRRPFKENYLDEMAKKHLSQPVV